MKLSTSNQLQGTVEDIHFGAIMNTHPIARFTREWKIQKVRLAEDGCNFNEYARRFRRNGVMKPVVRFITGGSRGLGLEIARAALKHDDAVVAAARKPGEGFDFALEAVSPIRRRTI